MAELSQLENDNEFHWVRFAKLYAIASQALPDQRAELSDRSLELLRKAVELGFKDAERLRQDDDLAPLRELAEFKQLVAEVEESAK